MLRTYRCIHCDLYFKAGSVARPMNPGSNSLRYRYLCCSDCGTWHRLQRKNGSYLLQSKSGPLTIRIPHGIAECTKRTIAQYPAELRRFMEDVAGRNPTFIILRSLPLLIVLHIGEWLKVVVHGLVPIRSRSHSGWTRRCEIGQPGETDSLLESLPCLNCEHVTSLSEFPTDRFELTFYTCPRCKQNALWLQNIGTGIAFWNGSEMTLRYLG